MTLILRGDKGAPLTMQEMDQNLKCLHERLLALESRASAYEGLYKVIQEGRRITLKGRFGTTYGHFSIPLCSYTYKGLWEQGKTYEPGDVVIYNGYVTLCLESHTSDMDPLEKQESSSENPWQILFHGPTLMASSPKIPQPKNPQGE